LKIGPALTCINVPLLGKTQTPSMPHSGLQGGNDAMDTADLVYLVFAIAAFCIFAATLFFVSREDALRRDGQFVKDAYAAEDDSHQTRLRAA
jgi:hypothetical protein